MYKENINIAFLFSKVAESYSYTMHEAECSCVPIITSCHSGNISLQIKQRNIYGICLQNYLSIYQFLSDKEKVVNFVNKNNKATLNFMENNLNE